MATKPRFFDLTYFYHIYNCGVEKRVIFQNDRDYARFLETIFYYLHKQAISLVEFQRLSPEMQKFYTERNPRVNETLRVKLLTYCLMPNHFHLVLKPNLEGGISEFMADVANSYTRYFNVKNDRIGSLLKGPFSSKEIRTQGSLMQVTRYIHLNPCLSKTINSNGKLKPQDYPYSSYSDWLCIFKPNPKKPNPKGLIVDTEAVRECIQNAGGLESYKSFIKSKTSHGPSSGIGHLIIENIPQPTPTKPEGFVNDEL